MKKIYQIVLDETKQVEETVVEKNDKNEEIKITKKVDKKVPRSFFVRKPNRSLFDSAAIFFAKTKSELISKGILSSTQLSKRFINDGGVLSEIDSQRFTKLQEDYKSKQLEFSSLSSKPEAERNEDEKKKITDTFSELVTLYTEIKDYEQFGSDLYSQTAEKMAENFTIRWWLLYLAYEELGENKYKPLFGEGNYEEKLKIFDEIEDKENEFEYELVKKLLLVVTLYMTGKASSKEDFDMLLDVASNEEKKMSLEKDKVPT